MSEKMKKVLYWVVILAVIGGIAKACDGCSTGSNTDDNEKYINDAIMKDVYREQWSR